MSAGLHISELVAGYGGPPVLGGVSLDVEPGETVALLGANGAGKTTLSRTIAGLTPAYSGTIRLGDVDLAGRPVHRIVRDGLVTVPEGRRLFARLTVEGNLRLAFYGRHVPEAEIASRLEEAYERFPQLRDRRGQAVGTMSGGEQQMLAIAKALLLDPTVLVLDEPSTGLAPIIVEQLLDIIVGLAEEASCGVLLIEQNVGSALRVSDRAYVLERGAVTISGTAGDLAENEAVRAAYLGA
jgi:branched-chain amino acid transport system ATP-binding protein